MYAELAGNERQEVRIKTLAITKLNDQRSQQSSRREEESLQNFRSTI
jgi:hypothetical protein